MALGLVGVGFALGVGATLVVLAAWRRLNGKKED